MVDNPLSKPEADTRRYADDKTETEVARFHEDGFLVMEDVLSVDDIEYLRHRAMSNFNELQDILLAKEAAAAEASAAASGPCEASQAEAEAETEAEAEGKHSNKAEKRGPGMAGTMGIGIKHCYKEVVQRHAHRFEMPYKMDSEEFAVVLRCPRIMRVVRQILGDDCEVINKSLVLSSPGAADQAWHSDGPHLSATRDLPCHCLNVFVPLVEVTARNGPTEIRPGSVNMTRNLKAEMLKAMVRKTLRPIARPELRRGSVLLFDYRVLHRGTRNASDEPRPVLVYTFAKPYYRDTLNFPRRSVFD